LFGYVEGVKPCPSKTPQNATTINPDYTHWIRQDQHILHAIISSIAATVVTHLGTVTNAKQAWDILKTMYVGKSRIRIMALKQRVSTFGKGTQSMAAYLQGIKAIVDELSIIDNPFDSTYLVIHTLNGLTHEYREIAAALRSRESPIECAELHEKLMDFDMLLHREEPAMSDSLVVTANAASRSRSQQHQPRYNGNRTSHTAAEKNEPKFFCKYCNRPNHTTRNCFKIKGYPQRNGGRPQANTVARQSAPDHPNWIIDTGASHHIAQDLEHLTLDDSYPGSDKVLVGDGTGLEITHIGHTTLNTKHKSFHLNQVLCVPNIKSNLLSVSKLCKTNNCSVEFFSL